MVPPDAHAELACTYLLKGLPQYCPYEAWLAVASIDFTLHAVAVTTFLWLRWLRLPILSR
jgi:hypothetical protein